MGFKPRPRRIRDAPAQPLVNRAALRGLEAMRDMLRDGKRPKDSRRDRDAAYAWIDSLSGSERAEPEPEDDDICEGPT